MTQLEKQNIILQKLVENLSEFNKDHLKLMTEICSSPEEIERWKENRDKLSEVENNFNDFLLVRSGREPVFGSLKSEGSE